MGKFKYLIYSLVAGATIGFSACQSDEIESSVKEEVPGEVFMSVNINFDQETTRTTLIEEDGNLKAVWDFEDKVIVTDDKGKKYGVLTLVKGVGDPVATFEGLLNDVPAGESGFWFIYAGDEIDPSGIDATQTVELDITSQTGSRDDLSKLDFLFANGSYTPVNGRLVVENITLRRHNSFGHFCINLPDDVKYNGQTITISSNKSGWRTKFQLNHGGENGTLKENTPGQNSPIVITPAEGTTSPDFYVMVMPGKFDLNFSVTIDDVEYRGWLPERTWEGSIYKRAEITDENNNVTYSGIKVECLDHSKNPLAKWAESDLKRSGTGASATGNFTGSYTTTGSYYQFGRNYGYNNVTEAKSSYGTESLSTTYAGNGYLAYKGDGTLSTLPFYYANTIAETLYKYPTMFLLSQTNYGDYLSPVRGDTWAERAEKGGYDFTSPCPSGWKIPKLADFREILPTDENNLIAQSSFNDVITQVKKIGDKNIPCAFRWSKETLDGYVYLKIESLVMSSDSETLNWENSNVVKRFFKLSGCITPFIDRFTMTGEYGKVTYQYVASPLEFGNYGGNKVNTSQGYVIKLYSKNNWMKDAGFYWTEDATQALFTLNVNSADGYPVGYYVSQSNLPIAANIRCIKAD